jgi:hypothetical protein
MMKFETYKVIELARRLAWLANSLELYQPNARLTKEDMELYAKTFWKEVGEFDKIGFEMCAIQASKIAALCEDKDPMPASEMNRYVMDLAGRLEDEAAVSFFLSMTRLERNLFEPQKPLYGDDVAMKFPSIAYEIDEAAKCLALGRSTASVFHSLRGLEAGIRATARCLGIPDPTRGVDRNWGNILNAIKGQIDSRWPKNTQDRLTEECRFFEDAHAALAAMMNPWRNAGMHLDRTYTEEDARHIREVVGGFMRKVASRMDEDGEPKA